MKHILVDHVVLSNGKTLLETTCYGLTHTQKIIVESIYTEVTNVLEADLSPEQVKQLFTSIEDKLTAQKSNKTLLGKAADVPSIANKIIDKIGVYLQDTAPVKFFDQKFEQLKIKVSKKFPNLENYLTKLGSWAKENPGKTTAVIGILTALSSLAGGPVGGSIAGYVLRGALELMKGEKLSTAAGRGLKTAAIAWLAGKSMEAIGGMISSVYQHFNPVPIRGFKKYYAQNFGNGLPSIFRDATIYGNKEQLQQFNGMWRQAVKQWENGDFDGAREAFNKATQFARTVSYKTLTDITVDGHPAEKVKLLNQALSGLAAAAQGAAAGATGYDKQGKPVISPEQKPQPVSEERISIKGRRLTESQVKVLFKFFEKTHWMNEGVLDTIKGAAGKVAGYVQTKGKNITTKVTADKLLKSWEKAGKPTNSYELAKWLEGEGLAKDTINAAITTLGIDHDEEIEDLRQSINNLPNTNLKELLKYVDSLIAPKEEDPSASSSQNAANAFAAAIAKNDIPAAKKAIGDGSKLDNATKTKIRSSIENSKLPLYYKRIFLKDLGKNVGYWMKEDTFNKICKILIESKITWKTLGINRVYRFKDTKHIALFEYASGGTTSAGNVASIANPGGAMMPMIRRMPAGQSFFGAAHAGTKKPKKKAKKR